MGKIAFRPWPKNKKREKLPVVGRRKPESLIFYVSNPLESQNHPFSAFPTPWKSKITHFLRFQPLGKAKSPNFCVSNPLESQNHSFFAFPTPWKVRIAHFLRFQPLGKAKSLIFCASNPLESQKTGKNRLSSRDDERKTVKTAFHPRMTSPPKAQIPFDGQQQKGNGSMPVRHAPMCCIEIRISTSNKDFPAVLAAGSPRYSEKRASCSSGWRPGQALFPIASG